MAEQTFEQWRAQYRDVFDRLEPRQAEILLDVCYSSWLENAAPSRRELEVLVATGEGRKDRETARLSGRAPDNRLVHFAVPEGAEEPRPGDVVMVDVTYGAPHHLIADGALSGGTYSVRRTKGGDAWAAAQEQPAGKPAVSLGMPRIGAPDPVAVSSPACGA